MHVNLVFSFAVYNYTLKKLVAVAQSFVCARCRNMTAKTVEKEKLCDSVGMVKDFCYLGDRLHASGSSKADVMTTSEIGWVKLRECSEVLHGEYLK